MRNSAKENDVLVKFHSLNLKGNDTIVPFSKFNHSSKNYFPSDPEPFFKSSEELAFFTKDKLYYESKDRNKNNLAFLKDEIAHLATCESSIESKSYKKPFLGECLYKGFNGIIPLMSDEQLASIEPLVRYMDEFKSRNDGICYGENYQWVIISTRHIIIELIMLLFAVERKSYDLKVTATNGKYLYFEANNYNVIKRSQSNLLGEKITYSGFQFEKVMTEIDTENDNDNIGNDNLVENNNTNDNYVFSVVENVLDDNIALLLRCEMDSYNHITKEYTELKCYSPLSMGNMFHRLKLLKTWIQINMVPKSDLIIGIRNNYDGLLQDINRYTRKSLYRMINDRNNKTINNMFNLNGNIASQWQKHCLKSIVNLINLNYDPNVLEPQTFNIHIDSKRNIHLHEKH